MQFSCINRKCGYYCSIRARYMQLSGYATLNRQYQSVTWVGSSKWIRCCVWKYLLVKNFPQTSSREISSLLKVRPGIRPRFFIQNIEAKLPEKNIPSTDANATMRSPKVAVLLPIHWRAQSAFFLTQGRVSTALNKKSLEKYSFYTNLFL